MQLLSHSEQLCEASLCSSFFIVFMILLLACRHVLTVADGRLDWPSFASNHSKPTLSFCQEGAEADVATTRGETPLLFAAQQAPIAVAEA